MSARGGALRESCVFRNGKLDGKVSTFAPSSKDENLVQNGDSAARGSRLERQVNAVLAQDSTERVTTGKSSSHGAGAPTISGHEWLEEILSTAAKRRKAATAAVQAVEKVSVAQLGGSGAWAISGLHEVVWRGAADAVMMLSARELEALGVSRAIPLSLFNCDDQVIAALAQRVEQLAGWQPTDKNRAREPQIREAIARARRVVDCVQDPSHTWQDRIRLLCQVMDRE